MNTTQDAERSPYHIFAWQGFAYDIPARWNLAEYKVADGISSVRLDDDFGPRLDFEWFYARRPVKADVIRRRYDKIAAAMHKTGTVAANMEDMPGGWSACLYSMDDGKRLMAAYRLGPESNFFCLLKMYFESASRREAERIIRLIASSFSLYDHGFIPWAVYDIAFQLQKDFRLVATSFQAGRKLLVFEWRMRRLYLWFFSLSDMLLQKQTMEEWCVGYLQSFKAISGVSFKAGQEGEIPARSQWRRLFGNIEPVMRGCLRYKAWCRRIPDKNQIFLGVFNYRRQEDLLFLASGLESPLAPGSP